MPISTGKINVREVPKCVKDTQQIFNLRQGVAIFLIERIQAAMVRYYLMASIFIYQDAQRGSPEAFGGL